MKLFYPSLYTLCVITTLSCFWLSTAEAQSFCYPSGNVIIYSNYDGGYLNIDVDQDIPDLKIGITTYEKCAITISGLYAGNVTEVIYAGFNGDNDHCNPTLPTTSISGVPASNTSILLYPPVTWPNSNGYYYVICNYSCDSATSQGGCNTPDQVVHYYLTQFGGSLYYHYTQYGCWSGTHHVSDGGNCCIGASILDPQFSISASFSVPNDTMCAKVALPFSNTSFNTFPGATTYSWNFGDGTPLSSVENPTHIYGVEGNYTVTLIATNEAGTMSDTTEMSLVLVNCFTGIAPVNSTVSVHLSPNPATDKFCFMFSEKTMDGYDLKLFDPLGNLVLNHRLPPGIQEWCIDNAIEGITPGIYLAAIRMNGENCILKVILQE
ncbi:MAG: PKD domain-containing protein [Chitinophagaceae bacterium]|nr:PKD domain-containing protein [Chitinophagaceae bacterium]